jgi:hypothetical protein
LSLCLFSGEMSDPSMHIPTLHKVKVCSFFLLIIINQQVSTSFLSFTYLFSVMLLPFWAQSLSLCYTRVEVTKNREMKIVGKLYFCLIINFLLFMYWEKLLFFSRVCSEVAVLNHYCLSHMICFSFKKFFVVFYILPSKV